MHGITIGNGRSAVWKRDSDPPRASVFCRPGADLCYEVTEIAKLTADFDLAGIEACGVEGAFHQPDQTRDSAAGFLAPFQDFFRSQPVTPAHQALKRGIDKGERRAELVRDHGAEVPIKICCSPRSGQGNVK